MAMHHGFIAASCSLTALLTELEVHAGRWTLGDDLVDLDKVALGSGDGGWTMAAGEHGGFAFVYDTSMILSDHADMLIDLSRSLGTVVGCLGETASGTFVVFAAKDGVGQRFAWLWGAGMSRGMAMGEPLPTEAEFPLNDIDGAGLLAAMGHFGADPGPWLRRGLVYPLQFSGERLPTAGSIAALRNQHYEQYHGQGDGLKAVVRSPQEPPHHRAPSAP